MAEGLEGPDFDYLAQHSTLALTSPRRVVGWAHSDQSAGHALPHFSPTASHNTMISWQRFRSIFYRADSWGGGSWVNWVFV